MVTFGDLAALPLISLVVEQDPIVGGKPPRSPILSRRSYLSSIRGRRVGGHVFFEHRADGSLVAVQAGHFLHNLNDC